MYMYIYIYIYIFVVLSSPGTFFNAIQQHPRGDSRPKNRLQENMAIIGSSRMWCWIAIVIIRFDNKTLVNNTLIIM